MDRQCGRKRRKRESEEDKREGEENAKKKWQEV